MEHAKRKIGITFTHTKFQNYWNWFTKDDLQNDVELVELSFEKNNVEDIPSCDGFVLTGGVDVHPSFYGGEANYPNQPTDFQIERDVFEKKVYEHAQIHQLPVLGICRGMQLINVLEGGRLHQDLGEGNEAHKNEGTDKEHSVAAIEGTLMHLITGHDEERINSAHHQVIDKEAMAATLTVNAVSKDDGFAEGLEFKNKESKAFMLGVQWHPERMVEKEQHPFSQNIKKHFLQEVRNVSVNKLSVVNPATEEEITQLVEDTYTSLQNKVQRLQQEQKSWQEVPLQERVQTIKEFSTLLEQNSEELAAILSSEVGKPLQQARNEIRGACTRITWLTKNAEKYLSDEIMTDADGMQEKIVYEPLGVVGNISAWNYPYLVGVNVFVPALLGGNGVLYKPSEHATLTGLQIEKWLKKAGVPDYVFQTAIGKGNVGATMLDLPLDGYFFTGSYKTGKYIYERVAPKMVPCQCELGGKDPLYVADDVEDLNAVAAATADGAFYNNGQSCCAVERIYVHKNIYQAYLDAFVKEVQAYKKGLPTEAGVYIGPLSRKDQLQVLEGQVKDAVSKGAKLVLGGKKLEGRGYYFEPTVLSDVTHEMDLMKEESFGPLIGIMQVASDEEAVEKMADTEYGLTASVYSSSQQRAEKILQQLNTGTGYWNCCDRVSAALPWSGRKHSGFGSTLSHMGLRAFVQPKGYHLKKPVQP